MFSDILFRPPTMGANDMVMWRMFSDLLCLMIRDNHKIFDIEDLSMETRYVSLKVVSVRTEEIIEEES